MQIGLRTAHVRAHVHAKPALMCRFVLPRSGGKAKKNGGSQTQARGADARACPARHTITQTWAGRTWAYGVAHYRPIAGRLSRSKRGIGIAAHVLQRVQAEGQHLHGVVAESNGHPQDARGFAEVAVYRRRYSRRRYSRRRYRGRRLRWRWVGWWGFRGYVGGQEDHVVSPRRKLAGRKDHGRPDPVSGAVIVQAYDLHTDESHSARTWGFLRKQTGQRPTTHSSLDPGFREDQSCFPLPWEKARWLPPHGRDNGTAPTLLASPWK